MYACNYSIRDQDYDGEKRGNWQNWVAYFQGLTADRQLDHCLMLAEYRD